MNSISEGSTRRGKVLEMEVGKFQTELVVKTSFRPNLNKRDVNFGLSLRSPCIQVFYRLYSINSIEWLSDVDSARKELPI